MKIIAISTCGSYPAWLKWGVASIYNAVDKIIIVNGGIDVNNPQIGDNIPLQRELQQLKKIDINKKISQIRPIEESIIKLLGRDLDWSKCERGRARNITLAFQAAYHSRADWIYKFDSDQICDESFTRENLENLANNEEDVTGYRFAEYADFHRTWDQVNALPNNFTDDGSIYFKASKNAWAVGGGSPVHFRDQYEIFDMRTFHMRSICPDDVDEYDYFYKRFFYHTWGPNSIMELPVNRKEGRKLSIDEIKKIAHDKAVSMINSKGKTREHFLDKDGLIDRRFPPHKPKVVTIGAKKYIEEGWPKQ